MSATLSTAPRLRVLPAPLVGGVGGLAFVALVVLQNLLRAAAPPADANAQQVVSFYSGHHATAPILAVLFVVSGAGLVCFAAGMAERLLPGPGRAPALLGLLGVAGVFCLFATMLGSDLALDRLVDAGVRNHDAVLTAWTLHEAAFCVLLFAIAVALAGLSAAATADGLVGAGWRPVGLLGAVLLAATAAMSPLLLDGRPVLYVGLVGFAVWLGFVARSAVGLLRSSVSSRARRTTA
jgi:hypothetical protein